MTNQKQQMELGFDKARVCPSVHRRQRKSTRAKWWFDRMREAVERGIDWHPAPAARPAPQIGQLGRHVAAVRQDGDVVAPAESGLDVLALPVSQVSPATRQKP